MQLQAMILSQAWLWEYSRTRLWRNGLCGIDSELICCLSGLFRILGKELAELPLVAASSDYQAQDSLVNLGVAHWDNPSLYYFVACYFTWLTLCLVCMRCLMDRLFIPNPLSVSSRFGPPSLDPATATDKALSKRVVLLSVEPRTLSSDVTGLLSEGCSTCILHLGGVARIPDPDQFRFAGEPLFLAGI
ncbi:hypothetical protein IFM89_012914 [Coptis chinensis]|uniref:Uncharacterized protein n=1 Tax=Coptis chinensis TaxID=261450 RepID=A0A835HCS5_9MAGN|nr:hypothetical protein IFM89_012914 [Coptis chinensis]